jgi:hypothetical protein
MMILATYDMRCFSLRMLSFFLLSNLAILNVWYRFAWGKRVVSWEPPKRWRG